ncbi:hypothetical protein L211DRAFT_142271 [Terfezia boudieri ATCC MYA-4762]|uniref:C2H2-type domain-containing protein n=1 Tax=Terfezia boudieri ATCC MYA-4762 TaxID=1051890 RepID=A0A3N4LT14_9PEZI|nr:hypothetical protein L211DRAFT_142271 [Terfezia boudieri ATCC MYA-4762]
MPRNQRPGHVLSEPICAHAQTQPAAADVNHSGFIPAHGERFHNSMDNLDHVFPMGNSEYLVNGGGYLLAQADGHEYFYAGPQDHHRFDRRTSETVIPLPAASKDNGFVVARQRKSNRRQEKKLIICQFLDYKCEFMMAKDHGIFKNYAELKEDALRHLNGFQCKICGKRFGKRYGKKRHSEGRISPCTPLEGGNNQGWLSPEFEAAIVELEKAKKAANVMAAIHKCIKLCDWKPRLRTLEEAQRRLSLHDSLVAVATDQRRATTSPDHKAWSPQATVIQNSSHLPGPASGFRQDILVNETIEQSSECQEPGKAINNTSLAASSTMDNIYMNYVPGEMELNQIPQGPHVDTNINFEHVEFLSITEEEPPRLAQHPFEYWDFSGEGRPTTPDTVTVNAMPKGSNPYYSQHSPTQDLTGRYASAQHQGASEHDPSVEDVDNQELQTLSSEPHSSIWLSMAQLWELRC